MGCARGSSAPVSLQAYNSLIGPAAALHLQTPQQWGTALSSVYFPRSNAKLKASKGGKEVGDAVLLFNLSHFKSP